MNKKEVPILLGIFLLVHVTTSSLGFSEATCPLSPQTKVSSNNPDIPFMQLNELSRVAAHIYKIDALRCSSKDELKVELARIADVSSGVEFDIARRAKDGLTRYYPISISGKPFIVRVFLKARLGSQTEAPILNEVTLEKSEIIIQVLPGINALLENVKIKPHNGYSSSEAARSP